jgi:diguanylate cyclase (GGDEF)-like protein
LRSRTAKGKHDPRTVLRWLSLVVVAYVIAFTVWRAFSWDLAGRDLVGMFAFLPPSLAAVVTSLSAARRCGPDSRRASAWRWMAVAVSCNGAGYLALIAYQLTAGAIPFPSLADAFFLLFYPFFLIALVRFPTPYEPAAARVRSLVDVAIVALSATLVTWFLVLGPSVTAPHTPFAIRAVSSAYPVGDVLQLFGVSWVSARAASGGIRRAMRLLVIATLVTAVADILVGWATVQGKYDGLAIPELFWMVFAGVLILAPAADDPADFEHDATEAPASGLVHWNRWAPYLAPAVVFGVLVSSQVAGSFFERITLTIGSAVVGALVLARQFLAQSDLVQAQAELSHLALHDSLTGLPNRTLVLDRAERMLSRAAREGTRVAALYIDVDGFKQVNDKFGHAAGDALLKDVAACLTAAVREPDTVGRLGGDEFIVLLDLSSPDATAERAAERILDACRSSATVSIGIAFAEGGHADSLLRGADLALYQAKDAGRDRYIVLESSLKPLLR